MGRKKKDVDGRRFNSTDKALRVRIERAYSDQSVVERFMLYVTQPQGETGCWLWSGSRSGDYGRFWMRGAVYLAHRASYLIFVAANLPDKLLMLHSCDEKLCVNPSHLRPGTHADNMREAVERGRMRPWNSSLTDSDVAALRAEYKKRDGELPRLAKKYGTSVSAVFCIVSGLNWKRATAFPVLEPSVQGDIFSTMPSVLNSVGQRAKGENHHRAKLTSDDVRSMRADFANGASLDELCSKYPVKKAQASAIVRNKAWRHV